MFFPFFSLFLAFFVTEASLEITLFDQSNRPQLVGIPFEELVYFSLFRDQVTTLLGRQPSCCKDDREISRDMVSYEVFTQVIYPLVSDNVLKYAADEALLSSDEKVRASAIARSSSNAIKIIDWFNRHKIEPDLISKLFAAADFLQMPSVFALRRACVNHLYDHHCSHLVVDDTTLFDPDTYRLISNSDGGGAMQPASEDLSNYYDQTMNFGGKRHIRFCDLDDLVQMARSQQIFLQNNQIHFDFSGNKIQEIDFDQFAQLCQNHPEFKLSVFDFRQNPLSDKTKQYMIYEGTTDTTGLRRSKKSQKATEDLNASLKTLRRKKFFSTVALCAYIFLLPLLWIFSFRNGNGLEFGVFISCLTVIYLRYLLSKVILLKKKTAELEEEINRVVPHPQDLIRIGDLFFLY